MIVGYVAAAASGVMPSSDLERLAASPLARLPDVSHLAWSVDAD